MPVEFVAGDLFASQPSVPIGHGCNCAGAMGKGIAVEFKRRWPAMYEEYKKRCQDGTFDCGDVFVWDDEATGRIVFNLGTQKSWKTKATIDSISKSVQTMLAIAQEMGIELIVLPMIGAGLGGLPINDVKVAITSVAENSPVRLVVCESYKEGVNPETASTV